MMNIKMLVLVVSSIPLFFMNGIIDNQVDDKPNKRFFGFHFDFHATKDDKDIGKWFDESTIIELLESSRPDFVQVDTKGVHGISSYPTDVGFTAGPYEKDIMEIWRRLTLKYGVDLYAHYTTIMDEEAVKNHPDWGRVKDKREPDKTKVSIFSNYADSLFVPQVEELISKYDIDGIWVDADSWALEPEYGQKVKEKFKSETGLDNIPSSDDQANYKKYLEFLRRAYIEFANKYINKIHRYDPGFQIGVNWAYSKMMPEPVEIDIDYLSADMSGKNWVYDAAFDSRVFASYDKPWDLMSWSFWTKGTKPEKLLMLEAAEVISMGGGYQSYWFQKRNGSIDNGNFALMKKLSDFCREREQYCFETEIVPQIGVFFSRETWAENTNTIYNGGGNDNIQGITSLFLDAGGSVEIIIEHDIEKIGSYPMIVIPEANKMSFEVKNAFMTYVNNGGNLLVMGKDATKNFESELGVKFVEPFVFRKFSLKSSSGMIQLDLPYYKVKANAGTEVLTNSFSVENSGEVFSPFLTLKKIGRGNIAGLYSDLGDFYMGKDGIVLREFSKEVISKLIPNRILKVDSKDKIHSVASQKNGELLIQLINVGELKPFMDADYYGRLQPIYNVKLSIKTDSKPDKIIQQPEGKELSFDYDGQYANLIVPNIDVYCILQIIK